MIRLNQRKAQVFYTLVQILYWLTNGLMYGFASMYLQGYGFTNSEIGIVLGCAYGLAACLQPSLASVMSARKIQIRSSMRCIYGLIVAMSGVILLFPVPAAVKAIMLVIMFSMQSAALPCVNTLVKALEKAGTPINFGTARGIGSLTYAVVTMLTGRILLVIASKWIPSFYLLSATGLLLVMLLFDVPDSTYEREPQKEKESGSMLIKNTGFMMFVAGVGCFFLGLVLVENFMLQIMQNVGGTSASMSMALSVASVVELPALFFYSRLSKRFGNRKLLILAGWFWALRFTIVFFAKSPTVIYISQLMHFCTYAFYTPGSIDFMSEVLPAKDFLKGQAMLGSICSVGSVFATFCGGILLDTLGISATLVCIIVIAVIGAVLFTLAAGRKPVKKEE